MATHNHVRTVGPIVFRCSRCRSALCADPYTLSVHERFCSGKPEPTQPPARRPRQVQRPHLRLDLSDIIKEEKL